MPIPEGKKSTVTLWQATKDPMEPRKYSTGTKGRIKQHADKCKEFIRAQTSFNLAKEYIESLDPDYEDSVWQRFQNPEDLLPELQAWLDGGEELPPVKAPSKSVIPNHPEIKPASQLPPKATSADHVLEKLLVWLASEDVQGRLKVLSPHEAAEVALRQFHKELTD
ncbi:MAG: hypothetical protein WEB60_13375 [Terrimicrobiaceae bacterium]